MLTIDTVPNVLEQNIIWRSAQCKLTCTFTMQYRHCLPLSQEVGKKWENDAKHACSCIMPTLTRAARLQLQGHSLPVALCAVLVCTPEAVQESIEYVS